jgi:hypothetical protein
MYPEWWPWLYTPVLIVYTFKANADGGLWWVAAALIATIAYIDLKRRFGLRKLRRVAACVLLFLVSVWVWIGLVIQRVWSNLGVCLPPANTVRWVGDGQDVTTCEVGAGSLLAGMLLGAFLVGLAVAFAGLRRRIRNQHRTGTPSESRP